MFEEKLVKLHPLVTLCLLLYLLCDFPVVTETYDQSDD